MGDELERIRAILDDTSNHLSAVALIRVALVFICVLGFSTAFHQIGLGDIRRSKDDFDKNVKSASQLFLPARQAFSDAAPCNIIPTHDLGVPKGYPNELSAEQRTAYEAVRASFESLVAKCDDAYSPKISPIGVELHLDLRGWILLFPFLLILSELYLQLVRKKRDLLRKAAGQLLGASDQSTAIDGMLFAPERRYSAFLSIPSALLEFGYVAAVMALIVKFFVDSGPYWGDFSDWDSPFYMVIALVFCSYYSYLLYRVFAQQLEHEAAVWAGVPSSPGWIDRIASRIARWGSTARSRCASVPGRLAGSVLVLSSLYLAASVQSCYVPHHGYEMFLRHNRAYWPTSQALRDFHSPLALFLDYWGTAFYGLAIFFAATVLLYLLLHRFLQKESLLGHWGNTVQCAALPALAMFAWYDVGFEPFYGLARGSAVIVMAVWWLGTTSLWLTRCFLRPQPIPLRRALRVLYLLSVPFIATSLLNIYFAADDRLLGYVCYLAGMAMLWAGYSEVPQEANHTQEINKPLARAVGTT